MASVGDAAFHAARRETVSVKGFGVEEKINNENEPSRIPERRIGLGMPTYDTDIRKRPSLLAESVVGRICSMSVNRPWWWGYCMKTPYPFRYDRMYGAKQDETCHLSPAAASLSHTQFAISLRQRGCLPRSLQSPSRQRVSTVHRNRVAAHRQRMGGMQPGGATRPTAVSSSALLCGAGRTPVHRA